MQKHLVFYQKTMTITLSEQAERQSEKLKSTLIVEIQIYFSCLLGKRLAFYTAEPFDGAWQIDQKLFSSMIEDAQQVTEKLFVRFNTVMTKSCPVSDYVGPPPVTDFAIRNQKPYVPSWLNIDYKKGLWFGEYGWPVSKVGQANTKQVRGKAVFSVNDNK